MKCWKEYIDYLNDNPEGYWFKNKLYGYGWTPATKEGWFATLGYLFVLLGFVLYSEKTNLVETNTSHFFIAIAGLTILFLVICWRTGEPLKWRWGKDVDSNSEK